MSEIAVRGFWGPRKEPVARYAERWLALLRRLEQIAPEVFGGWMSAQDENSVSLDLSPQALTEYIAAQTPEDYADLELGHRFAFKCRSANGILVGGSASVGIDPAVPGMNNRFILSLGKGGSDRARVTWPLTGQVLQALAEEWEPDWGDAGTYELWELLAEESDIDNTSPRAGYVTYLSPGRRKLAPDGLPGRTVVTEGGGLLIDLFDGPRPPEDRQVVELDRVLRTAGALAAVPADRPCL